MEDLEIDRIEPTEIEMGGEETPPKLEDEPRNEDAPEDLGADGGGKSGEPKEEANAEDAGGGTDPTPPEPADYGRFKELGYEIQSEADLFDAFNGLHSENAQYKQSAEESGKYSEFTKMLMDAERKGEDVSKIIEAQYKSTMVESLGDDAALYEAYLNENPKLAKYGEKARQFYNRHMREKYPKTSALSSITDPDERDAFLEENKDDLEFEELKRKVDVESAKESISEKAKSMLSEFTSPSEDQEAKQKEQDQVEAQFVKSFQDSIKGLDQLKLNVGGKEISLATKGWVDDNLNIQEYLFGNSPEEMGQKYAELLMMKKLFSSPDSMKVLAEGILAEFNRETVESKLENPRTEKKPSELEDKAEDLVITRIN